MQGQGVSSLCFIRHQLLLARRNWPAHMYIKLDGGGVLSCFRRPDSGSFGQLVGMPGAACTSSRADLTCQQSCSHQVMLLAYAAGSVYMVKLTQYQSSI